MWDSSPQKGRKAAANWRREKTTEKETVCHNINSFEFNPAKIRRIVKRLQDMGFADEIKYLEDRRPNVLRTFEAFRDPVFLTNQSKCSGWAIAVVA
jgi:hypothetical protein